MVRPTSPAPRSRSKREQLEKEAEEEDFVCSHCRTPRNDGMKQCNNCGSYAVERTSPATISPRNRFTKHTGPR